MLAINGQKPWFRDVRNYVHANVLYMTLNFIYILIWTVQQTLWDTSSLPCMPQAEKILRATQPFNCSIVSGEFLTTCRLYHFKDAGWEGLTFWKASWLIDWLIVGIFVFSLTSAILLSYFFFFIFYFLDLPVKYDKVFKIKQMFYRLFYREHVMTLMPITVLSLTIKKYRI